MAGIKKVVGSAFAIIGIALLFCLCCLCSTASAEGGSTVKLVCKCDNGEMVGAMPWSVYRIGTLGTNEIIVEGDFKKYPVVLNDLSTSGLADAASTLKEYAFTYKLPTVAKGTTKSDGTVTFDNLPDGVYLIAAKNAKKGDKTYIPTPAIIEVDSKKAPDLTIFPKITSIRTLADEYERFSVKKIWENDGGLPYKPNEIVIDIYKDYEYYETVTLSVENEWSYTWETLVGSEWTIIERKLPEKCTVIYRNDGRRYVVVNTYTPEYIFDWDMDFPPPRETSTTVSMPHGADTETSTTAASFPLDDDTDTGTKPVSSTSATMPTAAGEDTRTKPSTTPTAAGESSQTTPKDTEKVDDKKPEDTKKSSDKKSDNTTKATVTTTENKLPQTGQLWWPVPVMAVFGLILIAVGTRIVSGCKRDDNE